MVSTINRPQLFRGDIWIFDLDPVVGHEQADKRPCLVISIDGYNLGSALLAVVLPITSKFKPLAWHVPIDPPEGGLWKRSYIITDQLRSVSYERIKGKCLGAVSPKTLLHVAKRLQMLLHLDAYTATQLNQSIVKTS